MHRVLGRILPGIVDRVRGGIFDPFLPVTVLLMPNGLVVFPSCLLHSELVSEGCMSLCTAVLKVFEFLELAGEFWSPPPLSKGDGQLSGTHSLTAELKQSSSSCTKSSM